MRTEREPLGIDEARRIVDPAPERVEALERRRLAADQAEHHALVLDETQRREIAGALGVVFEQEVIYRVLLKKRSATDS